LGWFILPKMWPKVSPEAWPEAAETMAQRSASVFFWQEWFFVIGHEWFRDRPSSDEEQQQQQERKYLFSIDRSSNDWEAKKHSELIDSSVWLPLPTLLPPPTFLMEPKSSLEMKIDERQSTEAAFFLLVSDPSMNELWAT